MIHELNITNFQNTGLVTPFPRYTFELEVKWTDDDGVNRTHGPQTYTFPNDLAGMPPPVQREFAERMIEAKVRVTIGEANWDEYS